LKNQTIYLFFILISITSLYSKDTVDVLPPIFSIYSNCGEYLITVSDNRAYNLNKDSFQLDAGILDLPVLIKSRSYNVSDIILDTNFKFGIINYKFSFKILVKDIFDTAFAVFYVLDEAKPTKKLKIDSIKYYPQLLKSSDSLINFGSVYIDSSEIKSISFTNTSGFDFFIKDISLKVDKSYKILNLIPKNFYLKKDSTIKLEIKFTPTKEITNLQPFDNDTLLIKNECLIYSIPLIGAGVKARIEVEDFDFDICEVGKKVSKDKIYYPNFNDGLSINNTGTGILKLSGVRIFPDKSPFKITNPNINLSNAQIFPSTSVNLKTVTFEPTETGEFFSEIIFSSNAYGTDSIAYLRGISYYKELYFRSYDFGRKRQNSKSKGYISIKNSSSQNLALSGFELIDNEGNFRIMYEEINQIPSKDYPIIILPDSSTQTGLKEYLLPIEFIPKTEGLKEAKLKTIVYENGQIKETKFFNYIRGFGFLPQIEVLSNSFSGKTIVNTFHKDTGYVLIKSNSRYADLFLKEINIFKQNNEKQNDFIPLFQKLPKDTTLKPGQQIKLPFLFRPEESGERKLLIQIISDAVSGNFNGTFWDTSYTILSGIGYNKVLAIYKLEFNNVIHCDSSFGKLVIRNISDTTIATVYDLVLDTNDANVFEIDKTIFLTQTIDLKPGEKVEFDVKFKPYLGNKYNYSLLARVLSDADTSITYISGNSQRYPVTIYFDTNLAVVPGMLTINSPPNLIGTDYPLFIDGNFLDKSNIDSIYLEIIYHKNHFKFLGKIKNGDVIPNWFINFKEEEISTDSNKLTIFTYGISKISKSGVLLVPGFMVMLGDTNGISFSINNARIFRADRCSELKTQDGFMKLSYCGEEIRKIQISAHLYNLNLSKGNIINDDYLTINYSIAIPSITKIFIYNSFGQLVNLVEDKYIDKGMYSKNIYIGDLSSGIYNITLFSGPYFTTQSFIISK